MRAQREAVASLGLSSRCTLKPRAAGSGDGCPARCPSQAHVARLAGQKVAPSLPGVPNVRKGRTSGRAEMLEMVSGMPRGGSFFLSEVEKISLGCPKRLPRGDGHGGVASL